MYPITPVAVEQRTGASSLFVETGSEVGAARQLKALPGQVTQAETGARAVTPHVHPLPAGDCTYRYCSRAGSLVTSFPVPLEGFSASGFLDGFPHAEARKQQFAAAFPETSSSPVGS